MPTKRKQTQLAKMMEQCRQMPGQLRHVCETAAKSRYQRHYHPRNPARRRHIVVDAGLAAALVVSVLFAGYIGLFYRRAAVHQQVEMSLIPSLAAVASGDALSAGLVINNNGKQTLLDSYLTIPASVGFVLSHSEPRLEGGRIVLGDIKSGSSLNVELTGYVVGEVHAAARINAVLHYRTAGFTAEDEKYVSESVFVSGSAFDISATFPESIAANTPFDFEIVYDNRSDVTSFANAVIVPLFPADWETIESSLRQDPATGAWTIDNVGSLQRGVITGRAQLRSEVPLNVPVSLQLFAAPQGAPLLQDSWEANIPVFSPKLTVNTDVSADSFALGQEAMVSVTMTNNESFDLEAHVRLALNSELVESAFVIPYNNVPAFGGEQRVRVPVINGLLSLPVTMPVGQTQTIDIFLKLRDKVNAPQVFGTEDAVFDIHGDVAYQDPAGQTLVVPIDAFRSPIDSDLRIAANARYYTADGEAIGVGPLPPRVGEKTTYFVFLQVENQLHPLRDVVVTARLGKDAIWEDKSTVSIGSAVRYDSVTRALSWTIASLPDYKSAFAGTSHGASLQISVLPDESMLNSPVLLLEAVRVEATDAVTGARLYFIADGVDTWIAPFDPHATDDGHVTL